MIWLITPREPDMPEETISLEHIQVLSRAIRLRLGLRIAELRRIGQIQDVVRASHAFAEALSTYAACALAECTGEARSSDPDTEATRLFAAYARYAQLLQSVATGYRSRVVGESDPLPIESGLVTSSHLFHAAPIAIGPSVVSTQS